MINLESKRPIKIVDVETTGLEPEEDRILELAIASFPDGLCGDLVNVSTYRFCVREESTAGAYAVHGIRSEDTHGLPLFADSAPAILSEMTSGAYAPIVVGHGVDFDLAFIEAEMRRAGLSLGEMSAFKIDTKQVARMYLPDEDMGASLDRCLEYFNAGKRSKRYHSAAEDVMLTARLLYKLALASKRGVGSAKACKQYPVTFDRLVPYPQSLMQEHAKVARNMMDALSGARESWEAEAGAITGGPRNDSHGSFEHNATYLDEFMEVAESSPRWWAMSPVERVGLILIMSKISRYLSQENVDHLRDIGGYAYLVKDEAIKLGHPDSGVK